MENERKSKGYSSSEPEPHVGVRKVLEEKGFGWVERFQEVLGLAFGEFLDRFFVLFKNLPLSVRPPSSFPKTKQLK